MVLLHSLSDNEINFRVEILSLIIVMRLSPETNDGRMRSTMIGILHGSRYFYQRSVRQQLKKEGITLNNFYSKLILSHSSSHGPHIRQHI